MIFLFLSILLISGVRLESEFRTSLCCCGCVEEPCPIVGEGCPKPNTPCSGLSKDQISCGDLRVLWEQSVLEEAKNATILGESGPSAKVNSLIGSKFVGSDGTPMEVVSVQEKGETGTIYSSQRVFNAAEISKIPPGISRLELPQSALEAIKQSEQPKLRQVRMTEVIPPPSVNSEEFIRENSDSAPVVMDDRDIVAQFQKGDKELRYKPVSKTAKTTKTSEDQEQRIPNEEVSSSPTGRGDHYKRLMSLLGELEEMMKFVKKVLGEDQPTREEIAEKVLASAAQLGASDENASDDEKRVLERVVNRLRNNYQKLNRDMNNRKVISETPPPLNDIEAIHAIVLNDKPQTTDVIETTVETIPGVFESPKNVRVVPLRARRQTPHSEDKLFLDSKGEGGNCNDLKLKAIIKRNIKEDAKTSKRAIQKAAEEELGGTFNVICSPCEFSFVVSSQKYCEGFKGDVACFAFLQPPTKAKPAK